MQGPHSICLFERFLSAADRRRGQYGCELRAGADEAGRSGYRGDAGASGRRLPVFLPSSPVSQRGYPEAVRVSGRLSLFPETLRQLKEQKVDLLHSHCPVMSTILPIHPGGHRRAVGLYLSHKI